MNIMDFKVVGVAQTIRTLESMGKKAVTIAQNALVRGMMQYQGTVEKTQLRGRTGDRGLFRRSGALARSGQVSAIKSGNDFIARLQYSSKYARIHQYGGTIVPVEKQYLTIPIHRDARNHRAGEFDNLFFAQGPAGPFLARTVITGKRQKKKLEMMFLLRKSVRIPKRLYILEEYQKTGIHMIAKEIARSLVTELSK